MATEIVSFPNQNGDFPVFYQRVTVANMCQQHGDLPIGIVTQKRLGVIMFSAGCSRSFGQQLITMACYQQAATLLVWVDGN